MLQKDHPSESKTGFTNKEPSTGCGAPSIYNMGPNIFHFLRDHKVCVDSR